MVKVSDLFYCFLGVDLTYSDMQESKDGIPFVSRTSRNNGVVGYVKRISGINPNPEMTISLPASGSVMECFLQEKEYYSGHDLFYLQPKIKMSKKQLLFYCIVLKNNKFRYSYGRQANKTFKDLLVPPIEKIPSWVEQVQILAPPPEEPYHKKNISLRDREWKWFVSGKIFDIEGTKTTPVKKLKEYGTGKYPYVTTQAVNNGVEGYFKCWTEEGNVICIDSAVIGYCSYQRINFSASDHVEKLTLKEIALNEFVALFLVTICNKEQYKYSYGRKRSQGRLRKETIKLPVDNNNNPDWQFMEDYIKSLPYSVSL